MKKFFKSGLFYSLILFSIAVFTACEKDDNSQGSVSPGGGNTNPGSIVGKWQKYQSIQPDGEISSGDPDEFWIFNSDGSFQNEDGGAITTIGTYTTNGNDLLIESRSVDNPLDRENFAGTYSIDNGFMTYKFVEIGFESYGYITIKFKKVEK